MDHMKALDPDQLTGEHENVLRAIEAGDTEGVAKLLMTHSHHLIAGLKNQIAANRRHSAATPEESRKDKERDMSEAKYPKMFTPIRIGNFEVPNRICHVPTDISSGECRRLGESAGDHLPRRGCQGRVRFHHRGRVDTGQEDRSAHGDLSRGGRGSPDPRPCRAGGGNASARGTMRRADPAPGAPGRMAAEGPRSRPPTWW